MNEYSTLFQGNLRSWLLNEHCYDQYSVIYNVGLGPEKTAICYNTPLEPQIVFEREASLETTCSTVLQYVHVQCVLKDKLLFHYFSVHQFMLAFSL